MRRLRLRHRTDGAQGVVQLGGGGNSVPGESTVFVITAASAVAAASAAAATTATAAISTAAVSTAVCTAGRTAASTATKLAQELVLVLDAPFTRPQLQHRPAKPEVEVREFEGHPRTSAKIDLNVVAQYLEFDNFETRGKMDQGRIPGVRNDMEVMTGTIVIPNGCPNPIHARDIELGDERSAKCSPSKREILRGFAVSGKKGEEVSVTSVVRAVPPRQNRADDVEEHEGGFCRRTHVTSDSFSTPASRRRAFIPTLRPTPPFASLDQHPAGPDWSTRRNCLVGEHPATRGFYGNGGGVARDNLVIGIAATAAGTSMGTLGCLVRGEQTTRLYSGMLNIMLRRKKLGSIPNRTDRTRSPGRCGQASSSSSVGPSLGRESHKVASPALRALTLDTRHRKTLRVCLVKRCRCATGVCDTDIRTRAKRNFLAARSIRSSIRENIDELAREVGSVQSYSAFRDIREKLFIFLS
ncbi:hypothetical protein ALC57_10090 [Trachymyrmex cornetzi]|uniref:Uncharacterized protein n=1 Tax=Trachymyrmex cornetzi TaxID=471704 RepID=A0A195DY24_9HYME|nr:hypothetical protein ALC57_10090 [Trachymyrmex cornetzi]